MCQRMLVESIAEEVFVLLDLPSEKPLVVVICADSEYICLLKLSIFPRKRVNSTACYHVGTKLEGS